MKAIILAAGIGSRLRPITDNMPKCMVAVNGQRIIHKQISNLVDNGIPEQDILVISGYKSDILQSFLSETFPNVTILENKKFDKTNNMFSLYLAKTFVENEEFLLMNSDVFFDSAIITGLLSSPQPNQIACDCNGYMEESMKITIDSNGKIMHISKTISPTEYHAVSIDVYKIGKDAATCLFDEIQDTIERKKDENSWTEVALDNIFDKTTFVPYVIKNRWFEIDNHEDLKKAESIFKF